MPPTEENPDAKERSTCILFNETKGELFRINGNLKTLYYKLKTEWKVQSLRDEISKDTVSGVIVLGCPTEKFTKAQMAVLSRHIEDGGGLLVMMEEGGEKKSKTNINFLLEEYGIFVNADSVIRSCYYKYYHPKECFITNGVLNRAILDVSGKALLMLSVDDTPTGRTLEFVFPFGATLNVTKPSVAILSTGTVSFPLNRPILAFYEHPTSHGKLVVLGSGHVLSNTYIDKEENWKIKDLIFKYLTSDFRLNEIDAKDPEISDYNTTPNIAEMAEGSRSCLQESDEVPADKMQLFHSKLHAIDMELVPEVITLYSDLNMKHDQLTLITPEFEAPLPSLLPAVFPPLFRDLPPPPLELYDLDEAFSSEKARLAQVTNKCKDEDLEYYIRECGDILGVLASLPPMSRDAKHILEFILVQLAEFKKLNQELEMYDSAAMGGEFEE